MSYHGWLDEVTAWVSARALGDKKFFARSLDSASWREHLDATTLSPVLLAGEGIHELEADTLVGRLDPAYQVVQWLGPARPTIVFHHGNNERPFDYGRVAKNTFQTVLYQERASIGANLISVRAPFLLQHGRRLPAATGRGRAG